MLLRNFHIETNFHKYSQCLKIIWFPLTTKILELEVCLPLRLEKKNMESPAYIISIVQLMLLSSVSLKTFAH